MRQQRREEARDAQRNEEQPMHRPLQSKEHPRGIGDHGRYVKEAHAMLQRAQVTTSVSTRNQPKKTQTIAILLASSIWPAALSSLAANVGGAAVRKLPGASMVRVA